MRAAISLSMGCRESARKRRSRQATGARKWPIGEKCFQIGFAVQLCLLRYPGNALAGDMPVPDSVV